jgi:hypothetical protein
MAMATAQPTRAEYDDARRTVHEIIDGRPWADAWRARGVTPTLPPLRFILALGELVSALAHQIAAARKRP